jgi:HD superfamily phosphohydrolase
MPKKKDKTFAVKLKEIDPEFAREIDLFVDEYLPNWNEDRAKGALKSHIYDAVWGAILLDEHETLLIDTPIFQRLRSISQTSVAYVAYPSAKHNRFSHSLGVMYQAWNMLVHLERNIEAGSPMRAIVTSHETRANVRFAALTHDLGHGPFSHTSEQACKDLPGQNEISEMVKNHFDSKKKPGIAEAITICCLQSPKFRSFVKEINRCFKKKLDLHWICQMILGASPNDPSNRPLFISEIISGAIDADKLDYIHRDAYHSGLQLSVNIDLFLTNLRVKERSNGKQLAVKIDALPALLDFISNRVNLHVAMYNNYAVRSADAMVRNIVETIFSKKLRVGSLEIKNTAQLLRLTDHKILEPDLFDQDSGRGLTVRNYISRLEARQFYWRGLILDAFSVNDQAIEQLTKRLYEATKAQYEAGKSAHVNASSVRPEYAGKTLDELLCQVPVVARDAVLACVRKYFEDSKNRERLKEEIHEELRKRGHDTEIVIDSSKPISFQEVPKQLIRTAAGDFHELSMIIPTDKLADRLTNSTWHLTILCWQENYKQVRDAAAGILIRKYNLVVMANSVFIVHESDDKSSAISSQGISLAKVQIADYTDRNQREFGLP